MLLSATALLQARGLSEREATYVSDRHRKRFGEALSAEEAHVTVQAVDALDLLPGQATHLLRQSGKRSLRDLRHDCEWSRDRPRHWCTYKKDLCDCGAGLPPPPDSRPPEVLGIDCEFRPMRFAAVDERCALRYDVVVPNSPVLSGILACDRPRLQVSSQPVMQALLMGLMPHTTLVGHTLECDLEALSLTRAHWPDGAVVWDVSFPDGPRQVGNVSPSTATSGAKRVATSGPPSRLALRVLAHEHLGVEMQRRGERHCAIQDAEVAMRLFLRSH